MSIFFKSHCIYILKTCKVLVLKNTVYTKLTVLFSMYKIICISFPSAKLSIPRGSNWKI